MTAQQGPVAPLVTDADASPAQRRVFDAERAALGRVLDATRLYANQPAVAAALADLHAALAAGSTLPPRVALVARARVAEFVDCAFCRETIAGALAGTAGPEDPREEAAAAFAEALLRNDEPTSVVRSTFTTPELVELGAWVGLQSLYSRLNMALGLSPRSTP